MQASIELNETHQSASTALKPPDKSKLSIPAKRKRFFEALELGYTKRDASLYACISVPTGIKWSREVESNSSDGIPSKEGLIVSLFKAYSEAKPSSKANLAKRICDMLGYDMRAQDTDSTRSASEPLRDLVITWVNERANRVRNASGKLARVEEVIANQHDAESRPITNLMSPSAPEPAAADQGGGDPPSATQSEAFRATPEPPQKIENP